MLYQVFSRNNDSNGNPYRLILVYDLEVNITEAYESRRRVQQFKEII